MSIAAKCPAAVRNPDTQKPVDKKQVYTVLKTACYDRVPEEPWVCEPVYTRRFLPEDLMEQRLKWAKRLLREGYTDGWFYRHVVWGDLCHTIIPGDQKKRSRRPSPGSTSPGGTAPMLRTTTATSRRQSTL